MFGPDSRRLLGCLGNVIELLVSALLIAFREYLSLQIKKKNVRNWLENVFTPGHMVSF